GRASGVVAGVMGPSSRTGVTAAFAEKKRGGRKASRNLVIRAMPRMITLRATYSLLASLAVRVVDGAELGFFSRSVAAGRGPRSHAARCRYRVELTALARRLLGRCGRQRAQVIRRLQAAQPCELVGLVELLARGAGHVDVERLRLVDPLLAARAGFHQ